MLPPEVSKRVRAATLAPSGRSFDHFDSGFVHFDGFKRCS